MQERFSKARVLAVLETRKRQAQQCWSDKGFGTLRVETTYTIAEQHGVWGVRCHEKYNNAIAMIHFIHTWHLQSSDFLHPELVTLGDENADV